MTIPKISQPLAKAIRTSEGILVFLINVVLGLGTIISPSSLPPHVAVQWAVILTSVHVVSRTLLKIIALQKGLGIGPPIPPNLVTPKA